LTDIVEETEKAAYDLTERSSHRCRRDATRSVCFGNDANLQPLANTSEQCIEGNTALIARMESYIRGRIDEAAKDQQRSSKSLPRRRGWVRRFN
jgi:hypothetical protein